MGSGASAASPRRPPSEGPSTGHPTRPPADLCQPGCLFAGQALGAGWIWLPGYVGPVLGDRCGSGPLQRELADAGWLPWAVPPEREDCRILGDQGDLVAHDRDWTVSEGEPVEVQEVVAAAGQRAAAHGTRQPRRHSLRAQMPGVRFEGPRCRGEIAGSNSEMTIASRLNARGSSLARAMNPKTSISFSNAVPYRPRRAPSRAGPEVAVPSLPARGTRSPGRGRSPPCRASTRRRGARQGSASARPGSDRPRAGPRMLAGRWRAERRAAPGRLTTGSRCRRCRRLPDPARRWRSARRH
jgi:hypothetical protein